MVCKKPNANTPSILKCYYDNGVTGCSDDKKCCSTYATCVTGTSALQKIVVAPTVMAAAVI